jgi:predicted  nucleic acid-binding Zn-ribbon protein
MATNTPPPQELSWWDRAISQSEMISNGFEVFKAWLARLAEWVLFFCLIANIIEIFPLPQPFAGVFGGIVLGTQVITLDVAGFGLASMGASAKRRGDLGAAKKATGMGWTLISIMMLTVGLVATSIIFPSTKSTVDTVQNALILVRIIVTVLYSHIVHSLRVSSVEHENHLKELEDSLSTAQRDLAAKLQELSSVQLQLSSVQKQVSSVQRQFEEEKERASSVQLKLSSVQQELKSGQGDVSSFRRDLSSARAQVEELTMQLDIKKRGEASLQADLGSVSKMRSDLFAVQGQLAEKENALSSVQRQLEDEQRRASNLEKQLSSVQRQVSSRRDERVSSGQGKVVQLDTARRQIGQGEAVEMRIRDLHKGTPVQTLSARKIAELVGCSPTTASTWKEKITEEEKTTVNE